MGTKYVVMCTTDSKWLASLYRQVSPTLEWTQNKSLAIKLSRQQAAEISVLLRWQEPTKQFTIEQE